MEGEREEGAGEKKRGLYTSARREGMGMGGGCCGERRNVYDSIAGVVGDELIRSWITILFGLAGYRQNAE